MFYPLWFVNRLLLNFLQGIKVIIIDYQLNRSEFPITNFYFWVIVGDFFQRTVVSSWWLIIRMLILNNLSICNWDIGSFLGFWRVPISPSIIPSVLWSLFLNHTIHWVCRSMPYYELLLYFVSMKGWYVFPRILLQCEGMVLIVLLLN